MNTKLLFIFILLSNFVFGQDSSLFRITEGGKVGYINNKGQVVIKAIYLEAGEFNEGLASFRLNGLYGFIDTTGAIVLPPIYDYVGNFNNGIADVYVDGEVKFVNKEGVQILPNNFKSIRFINEKLCVFKTKKEKSGIYDIHSSKFITTPQKQEIGSFQNGLAVVKIKKGKNLQYGVINSSGEFIVNFGVYRNINDYVDGYALVELEDPNNEEGVIYGVIDMNGNLLFKRPYKNHSYLNKNFHNGYAIVNLYKYWIPEKKGIISTSSKSYEGFINLKGNVVFNDTLVKYVNNFSDDRAFVRDHDRNYNVVDTNFQVLNEKPFENVKGEGFIDGYAVVESEDGWGIIDVNMNYVVQPEFDHIHGVGVVDSLYFFGIYGLNDDKLYGIQDLNGNLIVSPIIESFDVNGFNNGLIKVVINKRLTYLNCKGDIVWQEKKYEKVNENTLNITYLNSGYFYAYSAPNPNRSNDGWAISRNVPRPITSNPTNSNKLMLSEENNILYIKNFSQDTIKFNAQDSRLYLKLQARNKDGKWKDIEYLPSSWCGNSYHTIELSSNFFWQFELPTYEGDYSTQIRAELKYIDPKTEKEKVIYSNEFNGSVNPGQFWREFDYLPQGIMDPYTN